MLVGKQCSSTQIHALSKKLLVQPAPLYTLQRIRSRAKKWYNLRAYARKYGSSANRLIGKIDSKMMYGVLSGILNAAIA